MTVAVANDQDRIDQEASEWLVLAKARPLDREEKRAFEAWRNADARHGSTYAAMERTWSDIPHLTGLSDLVPPELAEDRTQPGLLNRSSARWGLGLSSVAAAALALIWLPFSPAQTPGPQNYATQVAQIGELTLSDGTRVTLGPKTTLVEEFTAGERRVRLGGGEAFFQVTHNAARPFIIEAGESLVRVTGTKFDVNAAQTSLRVSVLEGSVEVISLKRATGRVARPHILKAGQRLEIAAAAPETATSPVIELSTARQPGAWREGRLVYDNVRLSDLVADVNRYYAPGVTFSDPEVGELRLTASFKVGEIPAFMRALDEVIPVRAQETATGSYRLRRSEG
jgi:transmembrane sensor